MEIFRFHQFLLPLALYTYLKIILPIYSNLSSLPPKI
nr:MAG TPA: hypothetical protein [Caudoviricetes sp.]